MAPCRVGSTATLLALALRASEKNRYVARAPSARPVESPAYPGRADGYVRLHRSSSVPHASWRYRRVPPVASAITAPPPAAHLGHVRGADGVDGGIAGSGS